MTHIDIDLMLHDLYHVHGCVIVSFKQNSTEVELTIYCRPLDKTFRRTHFSFSKALDKIYKEVLDAEYKQSQLMLVKS